MSHGPVAALTGVNFSADAVPNRLRGLADAVLY
jgi:hypothetical protein